MKKFFITGTSSGIGKALAEVALEAGHYVVGFSRRQKIEHANYKHISIDLSDLSKYVKITFEGMRDADELVLVNNAGTLGDVKPVERLNPEKVAHAYNLNVTAPTVLSSIFLSHTADMGKKRTVINISSGAAFHAVPGWSTYCASKAALEMFTKVLKEDHPDVNCHAISPGIVDTEMQGEIRKASEDDFPELRRFIGYKKDGELADPKEVGRKILHVIQNPEKFQEVSLSLREVEL